MGYHKINWDPLQLAKLRMEQKLSYPKIADMLGCHHTTVMQKCWMFGIEDRPSTAGTRRISRVTSGIRYRIDEPAEFPKETAQQAETWTRLINEARR